MTTWTQKGFSLRPRQRGFHLVTDEILEQLPEISRYRTGLLHLFIQHTSAALTLNENADPTVRRDMESHFNEMVPEGMTYYEHTMEGPDDMPAHLKAALLGNAVIIPINAGALALGMWQGVYLCEHRDRGGSRRLMATMWGETGADR